MTIFIQSARDARERVPLLCEVPNTAHVAFVVQRTVAFGAPQGWRRYCWRGRVRSSSLRLPRARCRADGWAVEFRILVQQMLHFAQQRIGRDGLHEYRIRARHSRHSSRVSASQPQSARDRLGGLVADTSGRAHGSGLFRQRRVNRPSDEGLSDELSSMGLKGQAQIGTARILPRGQNTERSPLQHLYEGNNGDVLCVSVRF